MKFTDLFVKRPVLASVVSLLILLFGLRSLFTLPLQEYPSIDSSTITITTSYPGASAETIQSYVTGILTRSIASAKGIDYLSSSSQQNSSTISAHIQLNYNSDQALVDILSQVQSNLGQLPIAQGMQQPVVTKSSHDQIALMYLSFSSQAMKSFEITAYLLKAVVPILQAVSGIGEVTVMTPGAPAMRIWLNSQKLAMYKLTPSDISKALQNNNYQSTAGSLKGDSTLLNINAKTAMSQIEEFKNLIIQRQMDGSLLRLRDVADIELGTETYSTALSFDGKNGVIISLTAAPNANPLTAIDSVRAIFPTIEKSLPVGLESKMLYDATDYMRSSIKEVIKTIGLATLIVMVVMFLFLGSLRSTTIPIVTIPLSLIGVSTLMLAFGFSLNLLTLLAMVLAIGLVVDDAIVVVENVYRHIEAGNKPFEAALQGAREIATPVISMSLTLAAVYAPIAFIQGLTGALFTEFAVTLAASVLVSGVIALTLSPMMCSKVLNHNIKDVKLVGLIDKLFNRIKKIYKGALINTLTYRPVIVLFVIIVLGACIILALTTRQELAPQEDKGFFAMMIDAPQSTNLNYSLKYNKQFEKIYAGIPEISRYFLYNGMNGETSTFGGAILTPWDKRKATSNQIQRLIQEKVNMIPGVRVSVFPPPILPGSGGGMAVQLVVTTLSDYKTLYNIQKTLVEDAQKSGIFSFAMSDLQIDQPTLDLTIDRAKAADLGVSIQDIGNALSAGLSEGYVNRFIAGDYSYKVIPQLDRNNRLNPSDLDKIYFKTSNNAWIPLASIASYKIGATPFKLQQYQQLNSTTVSGVMRAGFTLEEGLNFLKQDLQAKFPSHDIGIGYTGQSRQFMQENKSMEVVLFLAIIIIFLVLAAQFESFRDPLIILISVPLSIFGALIFLNIGLATLNIYTQIGLVTLIGLISKHGILMVDFANRLRDEKRFTIHDAIVEAASLRLRPILMTTAAMVFGVIPLLMASGPGAISRFDIGLVISTGMLIGTGFTLFVVPTMYTYLTRRERNTIV